MTTRVSTPKNLDDVRAAFETRDVLKRSDAQLEELLVALASEKISDPAMRAQAREMSETIRQLMENRRVEQLGRRTPKLAWAAILLLLAALVFSVGRNYLPGSGERLTSETSTELSPLNNPIPTEQAWIDSRTQLTIPELARRAPGLRSGNLQAWWAGEQARQVQRLEAQAKRQALAGDRDGAALSASRADSIRSGIPALADFERPPAR